MDRRIVYGAQVAVFLVSVPGFAAQRTFVASTGNDAQPCSLTLPCRSFQAAITAVDAGGEVIALDSAGYGPFTVGKSVSVSAPPGVYAGITPGAGQDGINVSVPVVVKLSGLTVNGLGSLVGIRVGGGAEVVIERCTIERHQVGITISGSGRTTLHDTAIRWNTNDGISAGARFAAENLRVEYNGGYGIRMEGGASGRLADSSVTGNTLGGIGVLLFSDLTVTNSNIDLNRGPGILVAAASTVAVDHSSVSGNTATGISVIAFSPASSVSVSDSLVAGTVDGPGVKVSALNGYHEVAQAQVTRSTITRNSLGGVQLYNGGPGYVVATVSGSQVTQNGWGTSVAGELVNGTTRLVVNGNVITHNTSFGMSQLGYGVLVTRGDNTVTDNNGGGPQVEGSLTSVGGT
jgi:hypothetical protein